MDSNGRAVIPGMYFPTGERGMALVAESLTRIRADLHGPAGFHHHRQRKKSDGETDALTAIEETQGRAIEFFAAGEFRLGIVIILFLERGAEAVDGVAGEARDNRLVNDGGRQKFPRAVGVQRCDEIADAAFKEHAVATKTIVHQETVVVVFDIEKYFFVSKAMRAVLPLGGFLLMAFLAAADHHIDVHRAQANGVAISTANVPHKTADIAQVEARIKSQDFAVTRATRNGAVAGGLPGRVLGADFMTAGAGFSGGIFVIEAGGGEGENNQDADGENE